MNRRHMEELPVDGTLPRVLESLQTQGAVVICAEPGAGKTTRVPPALLDGDLLTGENPKVLLLQPRRVAARASACCESRLSGGGTWARWGIAYDSSDG